MITSKLTDVSQLKLPQTWERQIQQIIYDNKMLYEPWIETAKDYNELRKRLVGRGYSELPMGANPLLRMDAYGKSPKANTTSCQIQKSMIRKKN